MKAKIVLLAVIAFGFCIKGKTQYSIIPQPYENISWCIDQQSLNPIQTLVEHDGYIFSPCQQYNVNVSGTKQVDFISGSYINLKPGFKAQAFSGNGYFHADVEDKMINLAVFTPENFDGQLFRFEKFEIGIQLPADINQAVESFVNEIPHSSPINPYNPEEIDVKAEFYRLETQGNNSTWVGQEIRYGFYYREFERVTTDPNFENWYWQQLPTDYTFRVRFATPEFGIWKGKIYVTTAAGTIASNEFFFVCHQQDPTNPGFLKVSSNPMYLERGSEFFFPVGQNLIAPWCNDCYFKDDGTPAPGFEPYLGYTSKPKTFMDFNELLEQYADAGANYYRFSMMAYANEIEFEKLNDYTQRLHLAWELDRTIDKTKTENLLMQLSLSPFFPFESPSFFYFRKWDWKSFSCGYTDDLGYAYQSELGLNNATEFFTDTDAMKYWKFRLRYLIARYGYSTNIAMFETMGEINNAGNIFPELPDCTINEDENTYIKPYADPSTGHAANISLWQNEMARYIKQDIQHDEHLITVDYAGAPFIEEGDLSFYSDNIDVATFNLYQGSVDRGKEYRDIFIDYSNTTGPNDIRPNIGKPFMHSETGSGILPACDIYSAEWKKSAWSSVFSGQAGIALNWENMYNNAEWPIYGTIKSFIEPIDRINDYWDPQYKISDSHIIEAIFLSKSTEKKLTGVLINRTYNWWSQNDWGNPKCDLNDADILNPIYKPEEEYMFTETVTDYEGDHEIELENMGVKVKYQMDWYDGNTGAYLVSTFRRSTLYQKLLIEFPYITGNSSRPILAFRIYKDNSTFYEEIVENENSLASSEVIINDSSENVILSRPKEIAKKIEFEIFPNPAEDFLYIQFSDNFTSVDIEIFDIFGKMVITKEMASIEETKINISGLPDAVYVLNIKQTDNIIASKRFIKGK